MNILDKTAKRECTSCQMCAAVCPRNAITIRLNESGFYRPVVDNELCIDCGICIKSCYKFDSNLQISTGHSLSKMQLYSASAKDYNVLFETTSGGVADLLAHELYNKGYTCVGVVYNSESDRAEHKIANSEDDLLAFRGSKYIQSYSLDALKELVQLCKIQKYAVFGTPCQIYALDKFLRQSKCRENFFLVDIFCHGCPSIFVWNKYHEQVIGKLVKSIRGKVNFRAKVKSWGWYNISVIDKNKIVFKSSPKHDEFYTLFFSDQVLNDSCYSCHFRSSLEYTDIRVGDFWGNLYAKDKKGVSAVCLVTDRGKEIFAAIKVIINHKRHDFSDLLPYQCWNKTFKSDPNIRSEIFESLKDKNLSINDSIRILYSYQGLKGKIKRYIKYIAYYSPFDFWFYLKRFF